MRAVIFEGPRDIRVGELPDPVIVDPTDAIVRVELACVCGSDLWYYRGLTPHSRGGIGHEFMGVVEQVGGAVNDLAAGDLVIAPFKYSDGTCANCLAGWTSACVNGGPFGANGIDGGQGELVRVPYAEATLLKLPDRDLSAYSDEMLRSHLALSDVMPTGHHAAVCAGVKSGSVAAVVGDGAVGLCAIIAARRLGAERVIALSRNPQRQELARELGATDIVAERGDAAVWAVLELTGGVGADAVLECVGTEESFATAFGIARPGANVGFVGLPHGVDVPLNSRMFPNNIGLKGGSAPVRVYMPELLEDVLARRINPARVFDYETDLDGVPDAYAAMDERRAVKALIRIERRQPVGIEPKQATRKGTPDIFTGDAWIDQITNEERLRVNTVRFAPGARNAWHSHALGQTLHVTEGLGLTQSAGGEILEIRAGDTVHVGPGEWHWHGAAPDHFMTHLAIWEAPSDGTPESQWGDHVGDEEYHPPR